MNNLHFSNSKYFTAFANKGFYFSFGDGSQLRYAMGLYNYSNYGNPVIGHGGSIPGYFSETRYFPEEDIYIICLVNTTGSKSREFFAEELTWKILQKKEIESANFDTELKSIEGKYSGQGRGTIISIDVSALSNSIIISVEGRDDPDTLQTYIGNNKWMNENNILTFANDELRIDHIYGNYKLQKQVKKITFPQILLSLERKLNLQLL